MDRKLTAKYIVYLFDGIRLDDSKKRWKANKVVLQRLIKEYARQSVMKNRLKKYSKQRKTENKLK